MPRRVIVPAMTPMPGHAATAPRGLEAFIGALSLRRVVIALLLGVSVAASLSPLFITAFPVLLGRLLVIAIVLLLVFTAAGVWHPAWVPRWLAQVLSVAITAPLITFVVYLPAVQGNVFAVLQHDGRLLGFIGITGSVLVIAPLLALGALYRERDAQARNQALRFELERSELEKQALDARLKLLHAQIEPHFLFNTLANVQELVEGGSPQAATVLRSLIAYLRGAMPRLDDASGTLGEEAALVRAYLELMLMRMPDRLQFAIDVPAELAGERFPTMALLTLVENAVQHGIDPSEQGGRIEVRALRRAADGSAQVSVADTGVGLRETAAPGTGLANLRARLAAFYGPGARLDLREQVPHGMVAEIVFPAGQGAR
jgi:signal transduction histidine kinase